MALVENRKITNIDENEIKRIVREILKERSEYRMCFGTIIVILYITVNFLVWNYGGVVGFFLHQPFDIWFLSVLQIEIVLNILFGLLILLVIWITK